jgi:hypothetical protein
MAWKAVRLERFYFTMGLWILAVVAVPFVAYLIFGNLYFVIGLVLVNAISYWVSYAIFAIFCLMYLP